MPPGPSMPYGPPAGGHPDGAAPVLDRAVFTEAYAFIPHSVQRDIVASLLPHWSTTRAWVLARPMTGFAETFSHYVLEVGSGGGSDRPEPDDHAEGMLFVTEGAALLDLAGTVHRLSPGGFAYLPPARGWTLRATGEGPARLHWLRKRYEPVDGIAPPEPLVGNERDIAPDPMPAADGLWTTTRFTDPADIAHDMAVTIVALHPGAAIPFTETHVMEHGLYVLEGQALYRLNRDWVEVGPGDYMWLRAFCPQAAVARGPGRFRYLLYKDVNRHATLWPPGGRP